jgi:predicted aminopeptidase
LLAREHGDFAAFYREVKRLAALPKAERDAELRRLAPEAAES